MKPRFEIATYLMFYVFGMLAGAGVADLTHPPCPPPIKKIEYSIPVITDYSEDDVELTRRLRDLR